MNINQLFRWLNATQQKVHAWFFVHEDDINKCFDRLAKNCGRMVTLGIIFNVIASYFYPDFPERFPVMYAWFDGWVQLYEFALKSVLKFLEALFSGHINEFWSEYSNDFHLLWQQFVIWITSL